MNRVLTSEIWTEVKRRASTAKTRKAAIAYVTEDLIGLRAGDVLIIDASERAVRSGQTNAHLLRNLHRKGVSIHSRKGLHSKVLLLGQYAIIGFGQYVWLWSDRSIDSIGQSHDLIGHRFIHSAIGDAVEQIDGRTYRSLMPDKGRSERMA